VVIHHDMGDILLAPLFLEQGTEEAKLKAKSDLWKFSRRYEAMYIALENMVSNYAQTGRVTDHFVADVARMLEEWNDE
jgi:hypothetical protein